VKKLQVEIQQHSTGTVQSNPSGDISLTNVDKCGNHGNDVDRVSNSAAAKDCDEIAKNDHDSVTKEVTKKSMWRWLWPF